MNGQMQVMNVDNHFSGAGEEVPAGNEAVGNFPVGYGGGVDGVKVTMPHCSASNVALHNGEANFDQLTLSFRGKIYVFGGVTTHKVRTFNCFIGL